MNSTSSVPSLKPVSSATTWRHLPELLKVALDTVLLSLDSLSEESSKQVLTQLTWRYGAVLSKFVQLNVLKKQEALAGQQGRIALLQDIPVLQKLSYFDLMKLAEHMEELTLDTGVELLTQGQPSEGVYLIETGGVQIFVNEEIIAHLGMGKCVGEMSCLRGELNASATVRTFVPSRVLRIRRERFMETVNQSPPLWQSVFHEMTTRFQGATHRLSELLQHNPQGLMKVDSQGRITNEFSTQCSLYFGQEQLSGQMFHELVFAHNPTAQTDWNDVYPLFFEDIPMDFRQLADILPQETSFQHPNGQNRQYALSYYACKNPQGQTVAVDVGIEDVTQARELSQKSAVLEAEKAILQQMYDNPNLFLNMLQLASEVVAQVGVFGALLSTRPDHLESERMAEVMRLLHSLKGSSGMFQLEGLKEACHRMEDGLRAIKNAQAITENELQKFLEQQTELEKQSAYARSFVDNMGEELRRRLTGIVLSREEFTALKTLVTQGQRQSVRDLIRQLETLPAKKWAQPWTHEIQRLSQRTGKRAQLILEGDNLAIPQSLADALDAPVLHILRNSLDHGLELPQERLDAGKAEEGRITFSVRKEAGELWLEIADDGRGLNLPKIIQKAKNHTELNQTVVAVYLAEKQPWKILFLPGFSTASQVTDISGRGVGLDVVWQTVTELGGTVAVESEPGQGCRFTLRIPWST